VGQSEVVLVAVVVLDDELDVSLGVVEVLEDSVDAAAGGAAVVDFDEPRASFL
jgi:hypothetical protein